jgi:hypothetical protein
MFSLSPRKIKKRDKNKEEKNTAQSLFYVEVILKIE